MCYFVLSTKGEAVTQPSFFVSIKEAVNALRTRGKGSTVVLNTGSNAMSIDGIKVEFEQEGMIVAVEKAVALFGRPGSNEYHVRYWEEPITQEAKESKGEGFWTEAKRKEIAVEIAGSIHKRGGFLSQNSLLNDMERIVLVLKASSIFLEANRKRILGEESPPA